MFKLNLKIAFRNLSRNKVYAAINIGGLAIGLTAFVLLLLFINHETNYDKWSPELDKVYQIREKHDFLSPDNKQRWQEMNDSRIGNLLKDRISQFKYVTKVNAGRGESYSIKIDQADPVLMKDINDADSSFFKVFPYHFLQGDRLTALNTPNSIVLKRSMAMQLFGTERVLGKQVKILFWKSDPGTAMTITGVVADPSTPESFTFNAITHTGKRDKEPESSNSTYFCNIYALASKELDVAIVNKTIQKVYLEYRKGVLALQKSTYKDILKKGDSLGLKAIPLKEVYSSPVFTANWFDKIKPVVALSIFLLLVSVINFVNLATAQSVQRAKEVGIKKVLGAYKRQIIRQFLFESALQSIAALFISIVLVEVLLPAFSHHFEVGLSFWGSKQALSMAVELFALFVLITLLAGFYPAWILSKYHPARVLKGNYETGFNGVALRNGLVIVQFIIAVTLIIGIGVMQQQTSYVVDKDLGYSRSKLINITANYEEDFAERIKRIPGVQYVATTTQVMGNSFNVPRDINYNNQEFKVNMVTVTMEALPALDVQVLNGRIFSTTYKQDTISSVVLNQTAANLLGKNMVGKFYKSGDNKSTFQVVGVIKDYNNEGFEKTILPTVYKVTPLGGMSYTNNVLVRFSTDKYQEAIRQIEAEWKKSYPGFPMKYTSAEDAFQKELLATRRLMQIVFLFSVISVILSLLGLFALSTFMAKRRTKEIAIRKILGASDFQIINMLNGSFLVLVSIANVVSWPIAFILARKWLEGFAYRIDMPIWPFVIATLSSLVIAVFTVSLQAQKAAVNNPVHALKYE